ncbi:hypothetical protein ACETU7_07735 [Rhodococcus sp. 3Y1]
MASTEPTEWEILRFGSKFQVAKDAAIASMYQAQAGLWGLTSAVEPVRNTHTELSSRSHSSRSWRTTHVTLKAWS